MILCAKILPRQWQRDDTAVLCEGDIRGERTRPQVKMEYFTFVIYITSVIGLNVLIHFLSILVRCVLAYFCFSLFLYFIHFIFYIYEIIFVCNSAETVLKYRWKQLCTVQ
jgi:hypothetical protein